MTARPLSSVVAPTAGRGPSSAPVADRRDRFVLPPLAEQTQIVAEIERRLSVVDELESVVNANLQRAARLRQSILTKAFTGNINP